MWIYQWKNRERTSQKWDMHRVSTSNWVPIAFCANYVATSLGEVKEDPQMMTPFDNCNCKKILPANSEGCWYSFLISLLFFCVLQCYFLLFCCHMRWNFVAFFLTVCHFFVIFLSLSHPTRVAGSGAIFCHVFSYFLVFLSCFCTSQTRSHFLSILFCIFHSQNDK